MRPLRTRAKRCDHVTIVRALQTYPKVVPTLICLVCRNLHQAHLLEKGPMQIP